jgi:hypothetical protein
LKRLLGAETVESDFKTAVFRFSDDPFEQIREKAGAGGADQQPRNSPLSLTADPQQTGANLPARVASRFSIMKSRVSFSRPSTRKRGFQSVA